MLIRCIIVVSMNDWSTDVLSVMCGPVDTVAMKCCIYWLKHPSTVVSTHTLSCLSKMYSKSWKFSPCESTRNYHGGSSSLFPQEIWEIL